MQGKILKNGLLLLDKNGVIFYISSPGKANESELQDIRFGSDVSGNGIRPQEQGLGPADGRDGDAKFESVPTAQAQPVARLL